MKFSDKLIDLRKKNGLSQEQLGEKLDVTRQTISKWELGQSKPDMDKLIELSKLFNVDISYLVDDEVIVKGDINKREKNLSINKPRKWLVTLLVIIEIIIFIFLVYGFVSSIKNTSIFNLKNNNFEKNYFNKHYEILYDGTEYGNSVSQMIDDIITNNKKDKNHIITFVYEDLSTTNPDEIKKSKQKFDTWTKYEVSFEYGDDGYINMAIVENIK